MSCHRFKISACKRHVICIWLFYRYSAFPGLPKIFFQYIWLSIRFRFSSTLATPNTPPPIDTLFFLLFFQTKMSMILSERARIKHFFNKTNKKPESFNGKQTLQTIIGVVSSILIRYRTKIPVVDYFLPPDSRR